MNTLWLAFLTGLTTGGISCLAVQGGLLASAIGDEGSQKHEVRSWGSKIVPVGSFITAKIISHTILGFVLGAIGSTFLFTPKILSSIQIFAGIFMILTALRLLNVHPIFRYFVITPPRWSYKVLRTTSKNTSIFAPTLLGLLSILMPCGITQGMMAQAVASGNPVQGALLMAAFVAGTSPIFFLLGATLTELFQRKAFTVIAGVIVLVFGIVTINMGFTARGSLYTLQNLSKIAKGDYSILDTAKPSSPPPTVTEGTQKVTINVTNSGYEASVDTLKVNTPVILTLVTNNVRSCSRAFTIPEFNISKTLPSSGETQITFTPTKTGRLAYSCSMGMYTGEFTVVQ